eukprot:NODE_788_length_4230_cov_0.560881.p3 type:complete len:205 gc:universal NODE_788_length_4230_cov_0.560881:4005-3391(-)
MEDEFNELNTKETRYYNVNKEEEENKCRICLSLDHSESICSFQRIKNCFNCGKMGHESSECVFDRRNIKDYLCKNRLCSQSPHFFEECPLIWRYYVLAPGQHQKLSTPLTCCIQCGSRKHLYEECINHPIKTVRTPFTELIQEFISLSGIPFQYTTHVNTRPWNNLSVLKDYGKNKYPPRKLQWVKASKNSNKRPYNKRSKHKK